MKYRVLLFLFSVCFGLKINSQSLLYQSGDKIESHDESINLYALDSLYLYALREHNYYLDVYQRLTLKREVLIKIPLPSHDLIKYSLENLFIRNDTFQIFYSYYDKVNLSRKLEMITFNRLGEKIGDTKLIDSSDGKNKKKAGSFSVLNRKKKNEFLSYGYKEIKDTVYINIDHFDYSGNKTGSQNFAVNYDNTVHSFFDVNCNLYHLAVSENDHSNWRIIYYPTDKNDPVILNLPQLSSDKFYLSPFYKTFTDAKTYISFFAPYKLKRNSNTADGFYIIRINIENHSLISENVIPFKASEASRHGKSDLTLSSCIPVDVMQMNKNDLRIIFESRLQTTTSMYGLPVAEEFDMGNIITIDLDSNNVITEIHKIRKQQHSDESELYTGFVTLNHKNANYFIYNELAENLERTPDDFKMLNVSRIDKAKIIYTFVDSGKVKRKILVDRPPGSPVDAILPNASLHAYDKSEIYLLRKIGKDVFLTKVFIED
jgi:hypothetical protein